MWSSEHRPPPAATAWAAAMARAERQHGLLRHADLVAAGVHPRRILRLARSGRLVELHRGVYAVGHRAVSRHAELLAAVWWVGGDAALSHDSAGESHGWGAQPVGAPIHVTTTAPGPRSTDRVRVHRTRQLTHHDIVPYGQLVVTDRVRTLIDLADHLTYEELRAVADQLPALPKASLISKAAGLPGRRGAGRTQRLIHSEDAHARFAMERRSVAYFAAHGVPEPAGRNVRVHGFRVDCWYPEARLVLELDSRAHHARKAEMENDRRRDRALKRHGVDTMRLMWHDLDPADQLAAEDVLRALGCVR